MNIPKRIRSLIIAGITGIVLHHVVFVYLVPILKRIRMTEITDIDYSNIAFIFIFPILGIAAMYIMQSIVFIIMNERIHWGNIKKIGVLLGIVQMLIIGVDIVLKTNRRGIQDSDYGYFFEAAAYALLFATAIYIIGCLIPEKDPWKKRVNGQY